MDKRLAILPLILFVVAVSGCTGRTIQPGFVPSEVIPETIKIASWNIENFGQSKATDPVRMAKIADIIDDYDIIAIQEISNVREQSDPNCPRNEDDCPGHKNCGLIRNALEENLDEKFKMVFSPQVKDERYLFVYNTEIVELVSAILAVDAGDSLPICDLSPSSTGKMVRQPFLGTFKVGDWEFTLMTAHTSPSINIQELEGLEFFFREAEANGQQVIIAGDLNADCRYLKDGDDVALRGPEYIWIVDDDSDTTVATTDCAYDRFIFKAPTSEDFTGKWGIVKDIPGDVSDHYLVWAEFWTGEDSDFLQ